MERGDDRNCGKLFALLSKHIYTDYRMSKHAVEGAVILHHLEDPSFAMIR